MYLYIYISIDSPVVALIYSRFMRYKGFPVWIWSRWSAVVVLVFGWPWFLFAWNRIWITSCRHVSSNFIAFLLQCLVPNLWRNLFQRSPARHFVNYVALLKIPLYLPLKVSGYLVFRQPFIFHLSSFGRPCSSHRCFMCFCFLFSLSTAQQSCVPATALGL